MPEIISFWLVCLFLFYFVERRAGSVAGFVALMLPMLSGAYFYAYEARPHIIIVALAGTALLCWDNAVGSGRPIIGCNRRWLIGFGFSLLAAFMLHCYGLLLVIPFAIVEIYRTAKHRRFDWSFWAALTVPLLPAFLLYPPMLGFYREWTEKTEFIDFNPPNWPAVIRAYSYLLTPSLAILITFLLLLARDRGSTGTDLGVGQRTRFSWDDFLLCSGFAALPAFGVILAEVAHTSFFDRYFLSAILGFCIPFGVIAGSIRGGRYRRSILLAIIAAALFLDFGRLIRHRLTGSGEMLEEPSSKVHLSTTPGNPLLFYSLIQNHALKDSGPIAILNPLDFLYLLHYAPALTPRLYYVGLSSKDYGYRVLSDFRSWSPVKYNPVLTGAQMATQFKRFYAYGGNDFWYIAKISRLAAIQTFWSGDDHFLARVQSK